jgi:hypothetical protein
MNLIKCLIVFFIGLIGYQLFLALNGSNNLIEGLENSTTNNSNNSSANEYKPYNTDDPNNPNSALILSQQNAGNIEVLKGRVDGLDGVKARVDTIQQNVDSMQVQIDALVQQQADYANDLAGSEPVPISGTEDMTSDYVAEEEEEI